MSVVSESDWQQWFNPRRFLILLGLVIVAGYPDVIFGRNTFVTRDFAYFGYPLAYYHKTRFWEGGIPLWNPLNNCGLPFLAQWNTMVVYPGSLFYLLLPLSWALGVFCLLHLMLGGLGMYFLSAKWSGHRLGACVAGMAFATNGLTLNSLMWPNNISALGWMPWVVLLAEKGWSSGGRYLVFAAMIGAMQMLTGAPEVILLTWLFVGLLGLSHLVAARPERWVIAGRLIGIILLVAGLAALQLLPFLDLMAHSQRDNKFFDSVWPMPGVGWANFLVPLFQCFKTPQGVYFQPNQYWTTSYYVGVATTTLAFLAAVTRRDRRTMVLVTVTLLGLVLALGNHGHLYPMLKKAFPIIGFMRFPIKFVVLVIFSLPLLAAYGTATACTAVQVRGANSRNLTLAFSTLTTVLIGLLVWFAYLYPDKQEWWVMTALSGLSRTGFLWAGIALVLLLQKRTLLRIRIVFGVGVVLLAGFDPMTYAFQKTPTAPRAAYEPNISQLDPRPRMGESRAVTTYWAYQSFNRGATSSTLNDFLVKRLGLFANCNLLEGIPKLDGFYSLYLREPDAIWSIFYFQTNNSWIKRALPGKSERSFSGLLDFIGASYLSRPEQYFDWIPRTNYLPLVTGGQAPAFADESATLRGLVHPDFDPRRQVFLPLAAQGEVRVSAASSPRLSATYSEQHVAIEISADAPQLLVLSQSYYHPWVARIDGEVARIWNANLAFQAIEVPAGKHKVQLIYVDWLFISGVLISTITWLGLFRSFILTRPRHLRI